MNIPCIALIGAPNSGKTTLYNWLTGSRFKTVNYPGATVEYAIGALAAHLGPELSIMDTPGVYSLHPKSTDEEVTLKALFGRAGEYGPVDGVLVVVDGTQLERHLSLALHLREAGFPFVVAITMADLLRQQDIRLDLDFLSKELGAPVLTFDGLLAGGLTEIVSALRSLPPRQEVRVPSTDPAKHFKSAVALAKKAMAQTPHVESRLQALSHRTRVLDRWLLHPLFGLVLFFFIMAFLFSSIYWMATPFMDMIDAGFSWTGEQVTTLWPGLGGQFLANGVLASFGAFLVFIPQIFILFVGIGVLESTGYLARAATLIDRPFSWLGLTGRSFVPILSGFSCAVPAMIASRNISSPRDRMITNFVVPLMTCSARLPVYALLLGFLFQGQSPVKAGIALAGLYFAALIIGSFAAAILNRLLPKDSASYLMMELPLYRRPRFLVVLRQALTRSQAYVRRAGPVIFVIAVLMWTASNFPNPQMEDAAARLEQSYAGRVGHFIEPLMRPMGLDWRVGVGLISAFAAREVFVATMAVTFHITGEADTQQEGLLQQMATATNRDGGLIFTTSSVIGLILFFMIALQCMSTFAIAQKESNSWRFAVTQLVAFNMVAYVLAVVVVQGLRLLGVS